VGLCLILHIPLSGGDRKAQAKGIRYAHGLSMAGEFVPQQCFLPKTVHGEAAGYVNWFIPA
jgi:hypothetical protein